MRDAVLGKDLRPRGTFSQIRSTVSDKTRHEHTEGQQFSIPIEITCTAAHVFELKPLMGTLKPQSNGPL